MEQRVYHGTVWPQSLAEHLVQQYEPKPDLQAHALGEGDSLIVQIGQGDVPEELRHAVSIAIARAPDDSGAVTVTMGQQQWITPEMARHGLFWGVIAAVFTPLALLMLLGDLSDLISSTSLPGDIWNTIDTYMASQGASLTRTGQIQRSAVV